MVQKALSRLSPKYRDVLILHAVEGFSGEEIAEILSIRPKTVWSRLHRARNQLQGFMNRQSFGSCSKAEAEVAFQGRGS